MISVLGRSALVIACFIALFGEPNRSAWGADDQGVREGQPAPDVRLPATQVANVLPDQPDAKQLRLMDLEGKKNVVLYFFPKAATPG